MFTFKLVGLCKIVDMFSLFFFWGGGGGGNLELFLWNSFCKGFNNFLPKRLPMV